MDTVNATLNMEYIITSKGRFRILKLLSEVKELNISEICRRTQTAYLSAKQHLQTLKRAGLVEEKNFGRIRLYRYREEDQRCQILKNFFEQLQQLHPLIGLPLNPSPTSIEKACSRATSMSLQTSPSSHLHATSR